MLACGLGVAACFDKGVESTDAMATGTTGTTGASTGTGPTSEPTSSTTSSTTTSGSSGNVTGGPVGSQFCQEACQADADCNMGGVSYGFLCQGARCFDPASHCLYDSQCWAVGSGWFTPCASQAECPGAVCVDIGGGVGRCATPSSDIMPCGTQTAVVMRAIEGDQQLTVCADTDLQCDDSVCRNPCEDNLSCAGIPSLPHCNVGTGECECTSDEQCVSSGVAGWTRCHDGVCGCGANKDCAGNYNADVCLDGQCGCSSVAVCKLKTFDATTPVCEPD